MKKILLGVSSLALLGLLVLIFPGCKKKKLPTITQDISYNGYTPALPSALSGALINLVGGTVTQIDTFSTNTDAATAVSGFTKDKIVSIKLKSLMLDSLYNSPGQNFDAFDTIRIYIDSFNDVSNNNKALFAFKNNIATGTHTIDFDKADGVFLPYFKADLIKILMGGHGNNSGTIPQGSFFKYNMILTVEADPN